MPTVRNGEETQQGLIHDGTFEYEMLPQAQKVAGSPDDGTIERHLAFSLSFFLSLCVSVCLFLSVLSLYLSFSSCSLPLSLTPKQSASWFHYDVLP